MMEIERKILEINEKSLLSRIGKLKPAAQKIFDGLLKISYFDFADGRIIKKRDLLRYREFIPKKGKPFAELVYKTYKGIVKGCKCFDELEFELPGGGVSGEMEEFLSKLGLFKILYYEKKRTLFAYKDVKIEIDTHPRIPVFAEIEAASPAKVEKAIKLLGLENNEQSAENIQQLIKRKYPQVKLNGLRFK